MKNLKIISVLSMFLSSALFVNAQHKPSQRLVLSDSGDLVSQDTSRVKFEILDKNRLTGFSMSNTKMRAFAVNDSGGRRVATLYTDGSLVVKDSLAAIKSLMVAAEHYINDHVWYDRFQAAAKILNYVNVDGSVHHKKNFDAAVKEYRKLMKVPDDIH